MSKKISELTVLNSLTGQELIPLAYGNENFNVKTSTIMSGIVASNDITITSNSPFLTSQANFNNGLPCSVKNVVNGELYITGFTENAHTDSVKVTSTEAIQYIEFKYSDSNNLQLQIGLDEQWINSITIQSNISFNGSTATYVKANDIIKIEYIDNKLNVYVNGIVKITKDWTTPVTFMLDQSRVITTERLFLSAFKIKHYDKTVKSSIVNLDNKINGLESEIDDVRDLALANSSSLLSNKKWSIMGDSNSGNNGYSTFKYHDVIKNKYNMTTNVTCFGGECWCYNSSYLKDTIELQMSKLTGDEDFITVMAGTNDFGMDRPIGSFDDRVNTTFYGALHVTMKKLVTYQYQNSTMKKLGVIIPVQRGMVSEGGLAGDKMITYVDAIKEVASYYSIPVLDLYTSGGLYNRVAEKSIGYKADNLHLDDIGQTIISNKIEKFLERL